MIPRYFRRGANGHRLHFKATGTLPVLHALVPLLSGGGKSAAARYENLQLALALSASPVPYGPTGASRAP